MECIIAYLLLAVFIDLALEIARMDCTADEAEWIKRSLWGQTPFDCGTRAVGAMATVPRQHAEWKKNRFREVKREEPVANVDKKPRCGWMTCPEPAVYWKGVNWKCLSCGARPTPPNLPVRGLASSVLRT